MEAVEFALFFSALCHNVPPLDSCPSQLSLILEWGVLSHRAAVAFHVFLLALFPMQLGSPPPRGVWPPLSPKWTTQPTGHPPTFPAFRLVVALFGCLALIYHPTNRSEPCLLPSLCSPAPKSDGPWMILGWTWESDHLGWNTNDLCSSD